MKHSEAIKAIRIKSLLSQCDFAAALGVSFSTINRWENGHSVPKLCKLKLLQEFCVSHNIPFTIDLTILDNSVDRTEK